ncbi:MULTISPECIES: DUF6455 family protein [Pseudophaeobacter]|jgi:hypothetical protein|uniref:DUF6455 family protein n=1 Tax=Pseudophaeobacter TaxID=1541822 RepID=UPI00242BFBBD|nr:DUF6455 family protein [Pseudophaeobacter profundi]
MPDLPTLTRHAALFDDMGQALGLDLQEEAISGRLQFDEICEAVLRCGRCAHPNYCAAQLARGTNRLAVAPDYCRNRDLLGFLKEAVA